MRQLGSGDVVVPNDFICIRVGGETYAVEIESVEGVIRLKEEKSILPSSSPHVKGIISLRGEVIPLIDLGLMFSQKDSGDIIGKKGVLVKVYQDKPPICILGDDAFIISGVSKQAESQPPKVGVKFRQVIKGIIRDEKSGENLIMILNPIKVFEIHQELSGIRSKRSAQES